MSDADFMKKRQVDAAETAAAAARDATLSILVALQCLKHVPPSREVSIAITHLETAQLFLLKQHDNAVKAVLDDYKKLLDASLKED